MTEKVCGGGLPTTIKWRNQWASNSVPFAAQVHHNWQSTGLNTLASLDDSSRGRAVVTHAGGAENAC